MKVIAGTARGMNLATPQGRHTRPTTGRIKETLFNIIQADVPGSRFIDLYSGSGSIAIEALSRGAKEAVFVDNNKEA
ncbi:MAG: RsmD family RNA methyltransferase, partial [Lachnospiraceae bacterium]